MESQTIRMVRCAQCGGLVVEGQSCGRCPGTPADPAGAGAATGGSTAPGMGGHSPDVPPHHEAFPQYGAPAQYGAPVQHQAPPQYGYGYGEAPSTASPATASGRKKTSSALLLIVGLIVILLLAAMGVFFILGDGADPLIPGWQRLDGRGVSLQVPQSYVGGDPESESEAIGEQLRSMGGDWGAMAQWIEQNKEAVLLVATDSQSATSGFASNVNIVVEKIPSSLTVEEYLASAAEQLPGAFELVESSMTTVGQESVGRAIVRFEINGVPGMQSAYAIKRGGKMYVITYTTSIQEWEARFAGFEQSVRTFRD